LMWAWPRGMFFFGLRRPRAGRLGAGMISWLLLAGLLLTGDLHALRSLTGARIGLGLLTANRKAAAMTDAAVAANLHQTFDVLRTFAAEVTLDAALFDGGAKAADLVFGQVADLAILVDARFGENVVRRLAA